MACGQSTERKGKGDNRILQCVLSMVSNLLLSMTTVTGSFPCFPDFSAPGTSPVSTWVVLNHPSNLNTVVISPAPFEVCPN